MKSLVCRNLGGLVIEERENPAELPEGHALIAVS